MSIYKRAVHGVIRRDLLLALKQKNEIIQPVMFLLMIVTLFPIGLGPYPELLRRIGPGILWIAAMLSTLLSLERMFRDDFADGTLEQLSLSGIPLPLVGVSKVISHWVVTFLPLIAIVPLITLLFNLQTNIAIALAITLLLGTPILSLVGAIGVALTVGLKKGALILSLLLIPIFIPLLIFATSAVESASNQLPYGPQLAIIGAMFLFTLAIAPFAIAYALKVSN